MTILGTRADEATTAIDDLTLDEVRLGLEEFGWCANTSADPERWGGDNQALSYGQCAVTAMLVQNIFGGDLMRTTADGVSHYFNRLTDGTLVDLTRDQFPATTRFTTYETRERSYVDSSDDTVARFMLLAGRMAAWNHSR